MISDLNQTDFAQHLIQNMFQPYIDVLGVFFFPIFYGFLFLIAYTNTDSHKNITVVAMGIILGAFSFFIFDTPFVIMFGSITGILIGWIMYLALIRKGIN